MNVDPKSSKNYDKAIAKTTKMNQGTRHTVGNARLTVKQIAEFTGMSIGRTSTCLKSESAEHFIKRMLKRKTLNRG